MLDRGDAGGAQLVALAAAHPRHQDQIALGLQPLLDERLPLAVIAGGILRLLARIEAGAEVAVALA